MDADVERLVQKIKDKAAELQRTKPNERYLVGISGIPGSGKTTLAKTVVSRLAKELPAADDNGPAATFVPMDGFHLTRAQLSAMADAAEAHRRRGAAFTFDGPAFVALVAKVRAPATLTTTTTTTTTPIFAPSFDHALKDPVADDVAIPASARVVVFEGNYLALDAEPWRRAGEMMDEIWFVDVDEAVARRRLAARHVRAGIVDTFEAGLERADFNDLVNGREIVAGRWKVDELIVSKEDNDWKE